MWRRFPNLTNAKRFKLRLSMGKKRILVSRTRKGLVIGPISPQSDYCPDHITVGMRNNVEEFDQVHRKIEGQEKWRQTPDSIRGEFEKFLKSKSEVIDKRVLLEPNTYLVSLHRIQLFYNLFLGLISVGYELFGWFFLKLRVKKLDERTTFIDLDVKRERIFHFLKSLRSQFLVLSWILSKVPPQVTISLVKRVAGIFLINPKNRKDLENDIGFLVSSKRAGIVISNDIGELRHLPYTSLMGLYEGVEESLPFGKLKELTDFSQGGFNLEVQVPKGTRL